MLRKTIEMLQNHLNGLHNHLTTKQAGLLFTGGILQQTDDSIPLMPLTINKT